MTSRNDNKADIQYQNLDSEQPHPQIESSTQLKEKSQYFYKSKLNQESSQSQIQDGKARNVGVNKEKEKNKEQRTELPGGNISKGDKQSIHIQMSAIGQQGEQGQEQEVLDIGILSGIYYMFCFISIQNNFNTGVIPASLIQIENELNLTFSQQATLGSLEYLGISIATFIVPVAFNKYNINKIISITVFFNGLFSLIIALSTNIIVIYMARFGQGFCASFGCIYAPIWINNFSPEDKVTTWMGIMQSQGPLGVMIGYSCAALLITITGYEKSWRVGFALLFVFTTITSIFFAFKDNKYVDILYEEKIAKEKGQQQYNHPGSISVTSRSRRIRGSVIESEFDTASVVSHQSSYAQGCLDMFNQFGPILRHHIFIYVCLGLCVLFYIVTGIQYWATEYFIKFAKMPNSVAMSCFSFIAITAPVTGALLGGKISDSLGGYKGKNRITALKFCVSVGLAAFIFSIPIGYVVEFWQIVILIWFLLAFGGALIPNGTGICLSCLPKQYHSTCSSLSQLIYNVGGYFMCPLISGTIMDLFDDKLTGLIWGWRSVLVMGLFGPILFGKALFNEARDLAEEEYHNQQQVQKKIVPGNSEKRTKAWSVI